MAWRSYVVSVATPGTPQNLFDAIAALSSGGKVAQIGGVLSGPVDIRAKAVMFQADPGNTAAKNVYVGSSDLSVSGKVGIGLALAPAAVSPWLELEGDNASLKDIWFDIDTGATTKNLFVTVAA